MRFYNQPIKSVWLKAAALGGFWGSIEIILGSYLHNLHVPMAGTFLTFLAIVFLTIFSYFWDDPGLALRASIIAALIKSISPSAILLGPMTAIILEGFLFDVGVSLFGRNLLGFVIAGVLTEISVVVHKILSLLIIYSTDVIQIAENFYRFLTKLLYIQNLPPGEALALVFLLYSLLGIIAAVSGFLLAKRLKSFYLTPEFTSLTYSDKPLFEVPQSDSEPLKLALNIIITGFLLWSLANLEVYYSAALIALAFIVAFKFYPNAFRFFKKIGFWVQIFIFWLLATLFYNEVNYNSIQLDSIFTGLKLVLRALVIIIFFSVLSIQIRTPLIKSFLLRRGLNNLYLTLKLAFSTLPRFIDFLENNRPNVKIFRKLIFFTLNLVKYFEHNIVHRRVFIVEGEKDGGKTQFMQELNQKLEQIGFSVGGIITIKKRDGEFLDYYVQNLITGQEVLLCTNRKLDNYYYKTRHFYFTFEGVKFGNQILIEHSNKPILFVDEIGVLELRDKGWAKTLETLLSINKNMIWSVRRRYTTQVLWKFFINEAIIFDIKTDTVDKAADTITQKLFQPDVFKS